VAYKSDAENSPRNSPELYRLAKLSDISDPRILGFYNRWGNYFRKDGSPQRCGKFCTINILGEHRHKWVIHTCNFSCFHVRLDEILSEENAPPEFFKLTRITVDAGTYTVLQKFGYLLGARGNLLEAQPSDDERDYEITLWFLNPLLVPPTVLLNLIDDCGAAQGWEWEVDTKR